MKNQCRRRQRQQNPIFRQRQKPPARARISRNCSRQKKQMNAFCGRQRTPHLVEYIVKKEQIRIQTRRMLPPPPSEKSTAPHKISATTPPPKIKSQSRRAYAASKAKPKTPTVGKYGSRKATTNPNINPAAKSRALPAAGASNDSAPKKIAVAYCSAKACAAKKTNSCQKQPNNSARRAAVSPIVRRAKDTFRPESKATTPRARF